jgi:hypothetical protein
MKESIEKRIIEAVKDLLIGKVNEILKEAQFFIPLIELSDYAGSTAVNPVITLSTCEQTEKERIIRVDTYSINISFSLPDTQDTEYNCYSYAAAVAIALEENPTLNGVADRVVIISKKYVPPKKTNCGENWTVMLTLRITVEAMKK